MAEITIDDALAALEAVVEKYGADTLYSVEVGACFYSTGTNAADGCIVGVVLRDIHPDLYGSLKLYEDTSDGSLPFTSITVGQFHELGSFTRGAIDVLRVAQSEQDQGETWGRALAIAQTVGANLKARGHK